MDQVTRDRLHLLYELNRGLTTFTDLGGLLRYAMQRGRELFRADGCAVLLLDQDKKEFYFPVASDTDAASEARLRSLRFPADTGIAGWVVVHDAAQLIEDTTQDPRFYKGIDAQTHMTTRCLLAAPLRTRSGNIGVIEVVNPDPEYLTQADLEFLETLGADVAVACEKAQLYDSLRGEVLGLRQVCRVAGLTLVAGGLLFVIGAVVSHLAWALPLRELPTRPAPVLGLVATLGGGVLYSIARGWLVTQTIE
ncbi:MAG: GAF domain-containing protein [Deltaproteobacteria bacterium]|nr:GAF domain-containing protein [Deltaproteobacteria bacterium]